MRLTSGLVLLAVATSSLAGVTVQKPGLTVPSRYASQETAARKLFSTSYDAYRKYATGHDDLEPISLTTWDGLGGWGASLVDALGTLAVMGETQEFEDAVNVIADIDFSTDPAGGTISVFETTIRWVGGLVSAYELTDGKYPVLITKAQEVADKLAFAFVGDNKIPFNQIDFSTNQPLTDQTTNIAQVGTLNLEWGVLSKYTGNATYGRLTEDAVIAVAELATPLPGLAPQVMDPNTGEFADAYITWGGGSDSYFEYLLKWARYTNNANPIFINTWKTAVDSSIKHLLKQSTVGGWWYLADQDDDGNIRHVGSHLACFYAGNWLMGGKLLRNQTIIDIALDLNEGCWNTYASTTTGIGPETFAFISSDGNYTGGGSISDDQLAYFEKHGHYITGADYIQRPEVLESNFYAWRVTGNTKYLDRAASAIAAFNKYLPAQAGFAGLNDVNDPSAGLIDDMQSFWFAEVLKYLFLTFDNPSHISLDTYVFNTECHPLKAPPALATYDADFIPWKQWTKPTSTAPRPAVSPMSFSSN
ncbi:glycoside hydrolase family 47 protein [Roridomyces roridus]|uniref:alpha-1,2-Mannosidase n=1 Tax=Roridomyces roridus TaxID=1738132 RepID=A0AAD7CAK9_9AGAR|nr:glycoside hydrolase family 47 protein [Roridomyces roridus]